MQEKYKIYETLSSESPSVLNVLLLSRPGRWAAVCWRTGSNNLNRFYTSIGHVNVQSLLVMKEIRFAGLMNDFLCMSGQVMWFHASSSNWFCSSPAAKSSSSLYVLHIRWSHSALVRMDIWFQGGRTAKTGLIEHRLFSHFLEEERQRGLRKESAGPCPSGPQEEQTDLTKSCSLSLHIIQSLSFILLILLLFPPLSPRSLVHPSRWLIRIKNTAYWPRHDLHWQHFGTAEQNRWGIHNEWCIRCNRNLYFSKITLMGKTKNASHDEFCTATGYLWFVENSRDRRGAATGQPTWMLSKEVLLVTSYSSSRAERNRKVSVYTWW